LSDRHGALDARRGDVSQTERKRAQRIKQAPEGAPEPSEERSTLVATDIMTENPRTVGENDPIGDAAEALESMDVRHLPVVSDEGDLVGMLSDRDLGAMARQFSEGDDAAHLRLTRSRVPVARVMSSDVACVDTDASVAEIVETMVERRVGAVPVVDGEGQVVGMISYVDVLRAVPVRRSRKRG
jgi:acetoin utilization protein AcuB